MRAYIIALGVAAFLLAGCSSSKEHDPVLYTNLSQASLHPKSGMAQLVFYYPQSFFWTDKIADIGLSNKKSCGLESGSFFVGETQPAFQTAIVVSLCGTRATSHLTIKTLADKKYYIRITPTYDNTLTELMARHGLLEPIQTSFQLTPSQDPSPSNGPFTIDLMDESSALQELQSLRVCERCS